MLYDLACFLTFRNAIAEKLKFIPLGNIDHRWLIFMNTLFVFDLVSCGLAGIFMMPRSLTGSLRLLEAGRSTPAGSWNRGARLATRHEFNVSVFRPFGI